MLRAVGELEKLAIEKIELLLVGDVRDAGADGDRISAVREARGITGTDTTHDKRGKTAVMFSNEEEDSFTTYAKYTSVCKDKNKNQKEKDEDEKTTAVAKQEKKQKTTAKITKAKGNEKKLNELQNVFETRQCKTFKKGRAKTRGYSHGKDEFSDIFFGYVVH